MSRKPHTEVSDTKRRRTQAERIVRILQVHKMGGGNDPNGHLVAQIAARLLVSERTIRRDMATLRLLYETLGTSLLDG